LIWLEVIYDYVSCFCLDEEKEKLSAESAVAAFVGDVGESQPGKHSCT